MASRLKNLTAAFSNVKIRTMMILTVGIMLLVIVVGLIGLRRSNQAANAAQLTKASNLQSVPGIKPTSAQYAQIQQTVNQQNYEQAVTSQGTAIPTIINQQGLGAANNPDAYNLNNDGSNGANQNAGANGTNGAGGTDGANGGTNGKSSSSLTAAQLKEMAAQQKAQMDDMQKKLDELSSQQAQQQLQQTEGDMQKEAQQLLASWNGNSNNPTQSFVQGDWAKNANKQNNSGTAGSSSNSTSTNTINPTAFDSDVMIKAGTVLFGVLTTAVNSDEPGPVMATIVDGQYKGTKLIGSIQNSPPIPGSGGATKLVLNFTTMSVPYLPESISVSAVAIDPDTARTALASDVDHHYLDRYGSLFASAFLEGWGQQISSAGTTVTVSPFGGTTSTRNGTGSTQTVVVNPDGTTTTTTTNAPTGSSGGTFGIGQNVAAGLGQIGTNWGQQLGDTFNRPNTVIINSGVSVGLLFLNDVSESGGNTPVAVPAGRQAMTTMTSSTTIAGGAANNTNTATGSTTMSTTPMPVPVPTQ